MKLITSDIRIRGVNKGLCLTFGTEEALKQKRVKKGKEKNEGKGKIKE